MAFPPSSWFVPNLIKGALRDIKSLVSCYVLLNFKQSKFYKKQNICKIFSQQIPLISENSKEFVPKSTKNWLKKGNIGLF
jgi:hypothetical protein